VNGMDGHLRDLLQAAVGEPPHRVSAETVHRRVVRRRVVEIAAAAVAVAAIAVIIPVGVGALGRGPGPSKIRPAVTRIFTSREYGYTEALPPGWRSVGPARQAWNGKGAPADTDSVSDLFVGPGGVEAWAYAAPTRESLTAYTAATIRAARAGHPCSAPRFNHGITIGGAPARLLGMICRPTRGFLVETAVTIRHGTAFVFSSQNPSGNAHTDHSADRAAFGKFLAGIRLPP
jgi:hypothetical protein